MDISEKLLHKAAHCKGPFGGGGNVCTGPMGGQIPCEAQGKRVPSRYLADLLDDGNLRKATPSKQVPTLVVIERTERHALGHLSWPLVLVQQAQRVPPGDHDSYPGIEAG